MTLTEEQRGTVAFDMEKARADLITANKPTYDYHEATARCIKTHMPEALAEIERLRAENLELRAAILGPDSIRAHQAARIKALEDAAKPRAGLYGKYHLSKADGSPVDPGADYFVLRLDSDPVARRAALQYSYMTPDRTLAIGLQEKLTKYNPKMEDCINLQFFGMERPRVWQITDERIEALGHVCSCLDFFYIPAKTDEVLRAMLKEAL